jgi:hypothetical protein
VKFQLFWLCKSQVASITVQIFPLTHRSVHVSAMAFQITGGSKRLQTAEDIADKQIVSQSVSQQLIHQ